MATLEVSMSDHLIKLLPVGYFGTQVPMADRTGGRGGGLAVAYTRFIQHARFLAKGHGASAGNRGEEAGRIRGTVTRVALALL